MEEMKYQNISSEINNDDETLTDDPDDETKSFSDTIISENTQNQLLPLPEPTLSQIQYPAPQPLDAFTSNEELVDSSDDEYVDTDNENQSEKIVQDTNPSTYPTTKP